MKKILLTACIGLFAAANFGCSSTTLLRSSDPEARIYVDGQYVGKGTATHTDTKIVGSSTMVMLKKEGCEPQTYTLSRSEEFDVGACAGGVFVLVPFLWIEKYRPEHTYEYECDKIKTASSEKPAVKATATK